MFVMLLEPTPAYCVWSKQAVLVERLIKSVAFPHPLCLSPCPLFCSFYWRTCFEMTEKLLCVQHYWSLHLRMVKRKWRN